MSYWVRQMNDGHWYVVKTYSEKPLVCEQAAWPTHARAKEALAAELAERKAKVDG